MSGLRAFAPDFPEDSTPNRRRLDELDQQLPGPQ